MIYMPKIVLYLKILTGEEGSDFVVKYFGKCFKFLREKSSYKLGKEKNVRIVAESFFTTTPDEAEKIC